MRDISGNRGIACKRAEPLSFLGVFLGPLAFRHGRSATPSCYHGPFSPWFFGERSATGNRKKTSAGGSGSAVLVCCVTCYGKQNASGA